MAQIKGAGPLREVFAAESRQRIDDGAGNETSGPWVEQFRLEAGIEARRGGESIIAGRLQGTVTYILSTRYSGNAAQITTDWRLRDARSGQTYNVLTAIPRPRRDYIDFDVQAGGADG